MVAADNLNLDVLELIFAYLSGNDLVAVALVSRSFFAGVIPRLYRTILFRLSQAKRYPSVLSPFAAILAHPGLAVHVRNLDIRTIPKVKANNQYHPGFLRDCIEVLSIVSNLISFTCTADVLPSFLLALQRKERLKDIRINANLTEAQAGKLIELERLRNITLDFPTSHVISVLPDWAHSLQRTLTSLTLYMASDLNPDILETVLMHLPGLTGLHVLGSPKVDHIVLLKLLVHTPQLESLSFTAYESKRALKSTVPYLTNLRNLSIDVRYRLIATTNTDLLSSILQFLRPSSPPLISFAMNLSDRQMHVPEDFVKNLVESYGATLRRVAFINCIVKVESVGQVCGQCTDLETLEVALPIIHFDAFTHVLSHSKTLQTFIDMGDAHANHGPRLNLTPEHIRNMMRSIPRLRKIVSDNREWNGLECARHKDTLHITLQKRKVLTSTHWFMPMRVDPSVVRSEAQLI